MASLARLAALALQSLPLPPPHGQKLQRVESAEARIKEPASYTKNALATQLCLHKAVVKKNYQ